MNGPKQSNEVDLRELFKLLFRRWWIIVLCILLATGVTGFVSFTMLPDIYEAESSLFIGKEKGVIDSISLTTIAMNTQLVQDYLGIVKSRSVSEEVVKELGIDISPLAVRSGTTVTAAEGSRFFTIKFQSTDPQMAANVVNKISQVLIRKAEEIIEVKNIQVIDSALVPVYPTKPNRVLNVLIAGAIGFVFGILIILLVEFMDYTFKKPDDVERILGLNVIGTIPKFKGENRSRKKSELKRG